jgi:hypothetical protein
MEAFLAEKEIAIVVPTPRLEEHPSLAGDPTARSFLAEPSRLGFRTERVPGTDRRVLVRSPR